MDRLSPQVGAGQGDQVILRRSARATRISLRVSGVDGQVTLTLPLRVAESRGWDFVRERADWIAAARARIPQGHVLREGAALPIEGRPRIVEVVPGRGAVRLEDDRLIVPGDPARLSVRVVAFLRQLARTRLNTAVDDCCLRLGKMHSGITLRDTRSRWGSCTAAGGLMFSWRLVMAPPAVLDYVAAHEVAHLAQMNHSPKFWAVVARLRPDYQIPRGWLREHGSGLHAWRFDPDEDPGKE